MYKKRLVIALCLISMLFCSCGNKQEALTNPLNKTNSNSSDTQQQTNTKPGSTTTNTGTNTSPTNTDTTKYQKLYFQKSLTTDEKLELFDFYMQLRKNEIFTNANASADSISKIYNVITTSQVQTSDNYTDNQKQAVKQFNTLYAEQNLGYVWTQQAVSWLNEDTKNGYAYVSTDQWSNPRVINEDVSTFVIQTIYQTSGYWVNKTTSEKVKDQAASYNTKYYYFVYIDNMGWRIYKMVDGN